MRNRMASLLGMGLVILWMAGLAGGDARNWLTWWDGLAAIGAFSLAAFIPAYSSTRVRVGGPVALAVLLFVLWVGGITTAGPVWQAWWSFCFACAFLMMGIVAASERLPPSVMSRPEMKVASETDEEDEKMRRGA